MSDIFYDGDFSQAQIAGTPEFDIPFKNDPKPYVYRIAYWQFLNSFIDISRGDGGPLGGSYVGLAPGSFKQIGGGVVEFKREFALVPDTRSEWESYVYDYHLVFYTFGFPNACTEGTPVRCNSRIQLDYFQTDNPDGDIDLRRAPLVLKTCLGNWILGEWPTAGLPTGAEVLAEDASFKLWKGNIYERRQRFVKWISPLDLINGDG